MAPSERDYNVCARKPSPLTQANALLADLQDLVRTYNRPTSWDVVGPMLLNEVAGKLDDARQILHALAELEATAHKHAQGCPWPQSSQNEEAGSANG